MRNVLGHRWPPYNDRIPRRYGKHANDGRYLGVLLEAVRVCRTQRAVNPAQRGP